MRQRREIETMVAGLERVVEDLDTSLAALPQHEMLALTEETVGIDGEMKMND